MSACWLGPCGACMEQQQVGRIPQDDCPVKLPNCLAEAVGSPVPMQICMCSLKSKESPSLKHYRPAGRWDQGLLQTQLVCRPWNAILSKETKHNDDHAGHPPMLGVLQADHCPTKLDNSISPRWLEQMSAFKAISRLPPDKYQQRHDSCLQ